MMLQRYTFHNSPMKYCFKRFSISPSVVDSQFIKDNLTLSSDHITPELKLYLLTSDNPLYTSPAENSVLQDPWWAIYWPGGQALSRFFLDFPEVVKGARVLDLGSGCGAVSLAAGKANAAVVTANDIDKNARVALDLNAMLNNVKIITFSSTNLLEENAHSNLSEDYDILCVGDMLYDENIGASVLNLCRHFFKNNKKVFIGDPGRWVLEGEKINIEEMFNCTAKYKLNRTGKLENHGFNYGYVWASKQST